MDDILTSEEQTLQRQIANRIEQRRMNQNSMDLACLIISDIRDAKCQEVCPECGGHPGYRVGIIFREKCPKCDGTGKARPKLESAPELIGNELLEEARLARPDRDKLRGKTIKVLTELFGEYKDMSWRADQIIGLRKG